METDQLISDEYGDEKIYVLGFEQTMGKKQARTCTPSPPRPSPPLEVLGVEHADAVEDELLLYAGDVG